MESYEEQFAYHANGIAFGARFATPGAWESIGSVALPSIGGRATASGSAYVLDAGFVTVGAAGSEVVGELELDEPDAKTYRTRATTWIAGLRIARYLEIERLTVRLTARYRWNRGEPSHEPDFLALEVEPGRIRLCEQEWPAQTTRELDWINGQPTFAAAKQAFMNSRAPGGPQLTLSPAQRVYSAGPPGTPLLAKVTEQGTPEPNDLWVFAWERPTVDSQTIACPRADCDRRGASPHEPAGGFTWKFHDDQQPHGEITFRFGEYVVSHGRRRFTAVRMSMTRSPRSELVIGELAINGSNHP
jgi:hypothetical protein